MREARERVHVYTRALARNTRNTRNKPMLVRGSGVTGTRNMVPRTRNSHAAHALPSLVLLASANVATHSVSQRTAEVPGA